MCSQGSVVVSLYCHARTKTVKPETRNSKAYILARLVPDSADEAADMGEGIAKKKNQPHEGS